MTSHTTCVDPPSNITPWSVILSLCSKKILEQKLALQCAGDQQTLPETWITTDNSRSSGLEKCCWHFVGNNKNHEKKKKTKGQERQVSPNSGKRYKKEVGPNTTKWVFRLYKRNAIIAFDSSFPQRSRAWLSQIKLHHTAPLQIKQFHIPYLNNIVLEAKGVRDEMRHSGARSKQTESS